MILPIRSEDWAPSNEIILEPNAENAVRSNLNTLVVAGPGAGKTELLAQRACFLLQTNNCKAPKRVLAISFKKDAATNLADRVEKRCGKILAQRFDSYTFDAFAKSLLDKFMNALPMEYKPSRNYEIVFPEADDFQVQIEGFTLPAEWSDRSIHEISARGLLSNFCSRSLPLINNDTLEQWASSAIWNQWLNNQGASQLTFSMISRLAEYMLNQNPMIVRALQSTYSHVFLDEFQDTTNIQYDLLKSAFNLSAAVFTAVGDDKQRIMGWAGALPNIFNIYCADFHAQRIALTMNHRSAPILVAIQTALSLQLDPVSIQAVPAEHWQSDEGLCEIHLFDSYIEEAQLLASQINEWICRDNLDPRRIVILAKQHVDTYAEELITQLEIVGQKARVESEMQDLLTEPLIQVLLQFLRLASTNRAPDGWQAVVDLLLTLNGCQNEDKPEKCIVIETQLDDYIQELNTVLNNITLENCSPECIRLILCQIVSYIGEDKYKNQFPQYKRESWFSDLLIKTSENLAINFLMSGEWVKTLDDFVGKDTIPIMTIHKSKGLEYDVVIFIGLEDGAFWNFRNQPQEDTRAFFVAFSRAKLKALFTFCNLRRTRRGDSSQGHRNINSLYEILTGAGVEVIEH
jgi:superfamily I DNA/RNA helicase